MWKFPMCLGWYSCLGFQTQCMPHNLSSILTRECEGNECPRLFLYVKSPFVWLICDPPSLCGPSVSVGHRYWACFSPGEISYHHMGSPHGDLFQKALEHNDTVTVWEKGMSFYVVYKRIEWPWLCHNSTDWNVYCKLPESRNLAQVIFRSWSRNTIYSHSSSWWY